MSEIHRKVIGHQKLTSIFGYWPSFHDAEVVSLQFNRSGEGGLEGPVLCAKIHVFQAGPETAEDGKRYVFHHHCVVAMRFSGVENLELGGFNRQNVLFDLGLSETAPQETENVRFKVDFSPSYGVGCRFTCEKIEITDIEKGIPEGSVYG